MNVWLIKLWMKLNDSLRHFTTVVTVDNSCHSCQHDSTTLPNAGNLLVLVRTSQRDVVIMNVWLIKLWMKLNDSLRHFTTVVTVDNSCHSCQHDSTTLPNAEKPRSCQNVATR